MVFQESLKAHWNRWVLDLSQVDAVERYRSHRWALGWILEDALERHLVRRQDSWAAFHRLVEVDHGIPAMVVACRLDWVCGC